MRVTADREVCVGAGLCALTAPEVFDQDDDGVVTVLAGEPGDKDRAAAREAGMLCPSGAVRVDE
ncbi:MULTISPECIES: ferredoxin [unclassified Streptomyces]|uniref:ferredoxin n=1 Tax=unclassified Streptomyces TaxID=2593676 RepID=UPI002E0E2247|nr:MULTISPECIES: (4Fe-4S)-binding protein [unclassified Streptomyces]WSR71895.1 (4Fe-4S)-binding protein [Streptomyces sp. NBC_01197]WSS48399.1 (4Fe-4S)-binding protein [Streptomyces sp. NBC_01180]